MNFKAIVLCFLIELVLCCFATDSSTQSNGKCHKFKPPVSYPLARRNESVVESRHGAKVILNENIAQFTKLIDVTTNQLTMQVL